MPTRPNYKKTILIVEDEKPMARALELKLSTNDFSIKIASDGEEALKILEKEKFDLILLDLILPKVSGFQVLEKIKEKKIKMPVIVLSNLGQEEDAKRAKELGAQDYFIKANISLAELFDRVKKLLS